VQFLPHVDPSARGPKTREAQLGAVVRGELLKFVELFDRLSGHDDRNLELTEIRGLQVVHRATSAVVTASAANSITGRRVHTIDEIWMSR